MNVSIFVLLMFVHVLWCIIYFS